MSILEFTTQFSREEVILYNFALNLTRDEDSARDLVQETAYKAFKYRDRYQPHTNLRAWLMTILRNSFINDYRKRRRRQVLNDTTPNDYLIDSSTRTVGNLGESAVMQEEIQTAMEDLEEWARVPFLMHCEGYKYDEIATTLGVPLGTVKSRIFFARQKLQTALKALYNTPQVAEMFN